MKFIHAVVFDEDEIKNNNYDTGNWDDLTNGDYIVHCLYDVDNENVIIINDNCHIPVETMIETFINGVKYGHSTNIGGLMIETEEIEVIKAFVVVEVGYSYSANAVKEKLIKGNYGEVL